MVNYRNDFMSVSMRSEVVVRHRPQLHYTI